MRTRIFNNKEQVFCDWRHKWVRLTPEEWVRQQLLHRLVEQLGYPASLIAVEVAFTIGNEQYAVNKKQFRADAVVYDRTMQPLLIIECKADTVPLTQKTLDQALTYNRRLSVPFLLLHNGPQSLFVQVSTNGIITTTTAIPPFSVLQLEQ
ncbi:MAG: type I restriction enzyme HsdR N-terminal domain-containing protein [Paludibacteraceae bacterium]|nr:type I restriction enzyme HsdR N-terminal domain-containing protein [Paludibacteraceae bacterium]